VDVGFQASLAKNPLVEFDNLLYLLKDSVIYFSALRYSNPAFTLEANFPIKTPNFWGV
jgi:hypothetical protein